MFRTLGALLGGAALVLTLLLGGCQKELQVPSYDIKIERPEKKQSTPEPATEEHHSTARTAAPGG